VVSVNFETTDEEALAGMPAAGIVTSFGQRIN